MAQAGTQELVDRFEGFYREYYREEVGQLAQRYPNEQRSLWIDWGDLYRFDRDLAEDYLAQPDQLREYAEEALRLYDLPVDVSLGQAHVRIRDLPEATEIREIRSRDVNTLVSVQGIVRKATDVRPKVEEAAFECQRCGTLTYIPQASGFQEPHECQGCERQGPFTINYDQSSFVDAQKLRVQESPEGLRGGETPQSIDVHIEDDVTGEVSPGDHVTVTGVLRIEQQESQGQKSRMFDVFMDGHSLVVEDEEFEEMDITEADKREIVELSRDEEIYRQMVDSIAPTIFGYDGTKLAMALQLFSGVTKHLPDDSRIRGDMHMLLIGDPGTGKCVDGRTKVTLAGGREVPIRELVESNLDDPKPVDDGVYDGIDVPLLSMDPDGTISERHATRVWKREAPDRMYRIRTESGKEITVTPSHPMFVRVGDRPTAVRADELSIGQPVAAVESDGATRPQESVATDGGAVVATSGHEEWPSLEWTEIVEIDAVPSEDDWVYDLEVQGTHTYVSNDIVSHNSQLLQYIRNIAPRSVYTSGKGSSTAGLTAAAVRDDFGDGQQWSLEAGALVLADKGIAAVDELDKMAPDDRSAMHEALEQQSYHPNFEILLVDGRRVEIGHLVEAAMADRPGDVVEGVNCEILPVDGIAVHSTDLDSNTIQKTPVDRISRHKAPDEFVRVTFSNGRSVVVTPEHPMFVDHDGTIDTVEAKDIEEDTFVPAPRKLPNSAETVSLTNERHVGKEKDVDLPSGMSRDLAEMLGLLIAEGHSYAGSSHEVGFSNQDERLLARADDLMADVFGLTSTDSRNAEGTVTKRWVSTKLYRWFESNFPEFMNTARGKRMPAKVLGASEEEIRRFLVGAFAGDGGIESESMAISTSSRGLADDYADALSKIGVASRIHYNQAEDSWKTYVMGDSIERFVEQVVEPADERYEKARAFVTRSKGVRRHHDVLPTSAAREIRELRRLLGLRLTGEFRPNLDGEYGVQMETAERHLRELRRRAATIHQELDEVTSLSGLRELVGWSGRQLAERLDGATTSSVHYAEDGGYNEKKRYRMLDRAKGAVLAALDEFERRADLLERDGDIRYYRVTDVETVPNAGEYETDWVYDVTVEPTNTFVSQGVVLHNSISISKAGINATLKSRCSLLGAANPKYGRFDQYEPIAEQIDLEPALVSRFDLIFTVTDQPDEEKDRRLADHILTTNYAGELSTQRAELATPNASESDVEDASAPVQPAIDPDLFRKYIAYAKRTCFPTMTDEARERIRDFYVDLRSRGAEEDAPVPITARKLEALVRLAEASARVRLSDTVDVEDANRVIDIVRASLQDIGVDPETGQFDADVVETGTTKTQRDRIKNLRTLIAEIEKDYEEGAPVEEVLARAGELGIDESKAEHEIEKLRQRGEVYEPQTNHLRTT